MRWTARIGPIDPADIRKTLSRSLAMLDHKHADLPPRKHGNPPQ